MIASPTQQRSEKELMAAIHKLADAGGSVIQVRTREPVRAALVLRKHLIGAEAPYKEWDVTNGFRVFTKENFTDHKVGGDSVDFLEAIQLPLKELRSKTSAVVAVSDKVHYFIYVDPQPFLKDSPLCSAILQQYAAILPTTNVCTVLVTPDITLDLAVGTVLVADLPTPSAMELEEVLTRFVSSAAEDSKVFPGGSALVEDDIRKICNMGLGLSLYEFETYTAIAVIEAGLAREKAITLPRMLEGIGKGKTAVVRQSEILELTHPEEIENVGGMGRLKAWLAQRANCYSEDAQEFGIQPPKGMVLVGVPGTGKSLVAKVTASVFEIPLVRLDFGRVFSKYVGDSESRVRQALKMVEGMAPVVLFVDEVDKGLGGAGGGGDSGTSSRVLGSFLTWLQECKAPVFTIVTANRIDGLPPELLRRGRFDEIFSAGMPNADDREEVLAIHLRKRNRNIKKFKPAEIQEYIAASEGYVPAEIESAVKSALIAAFNDETSKDLMMKHVITALKEMVPMSRSHKEVIDRIVAWAKDNATPVADDAKPSSSAEPRAITRRIITPRTGE